jgi:hypothetical protein
LRGERWPAARASCGDEELDLSVPSTAARSTVKPETVHQTTHLLSNAFSREAMNYNIYTAGNSLMDDDDKL